MTLKEYFQDKQQGIYLAVYLIHILQVVVIVQGIVADIVRGIVQGIVIVQGVNIVEHGLKHLVDGGWAILVDVRTGLRMVEDLNAQAGLVAAPITIVPPTPQLWRSLCNTSMPIPGNMNNRYMLQDNSLFRFVY